MDKIEDRDAFMKNQIEMLTFYKFEIPSICVGNGIIKNININAIECTYKDKIYIITTLLENSHTINYLISPKYNTELIFQTITDILSNLINGEMTVEREDICSTICRIYQIYGLLLQSEVYVNKKEYNSYYKLICDYGYEFLSSLQSTKVFLYLYLKFYIYIE